jgi:ribosome recycling factor
VASQLGRWLEYLMINKIKEETEKRMQKTVDLLQHELTKIRTGRANASLLDHIQIDYYGSMLPLNQVASVTSSDARTLLVTPWEGAMVAVVEKAILNSDLGVNPATSGNSIRIPLPPLTEERRKELIKIVRHEGEQARVSVRNIRRDANTQCKDFVKNKQISEDEERRASDIIQKLTDNYIVDVEKVLAEKEKDLLEV